MKIVHEFVKNNEFFPENFNYLVIGTFPSVIIKKYYNRITNDDLWFYYGSKENQFWKILSKIYNIELDTIEKIKLLLTKLKIGITDIIFECETIGNSTDNSIQVIKLNELVSDIILKNKDLKTIYFTSYSGKNSAEYLTLKMLKECNSFSYSKVKRSENKNISYFEFYDNDGSFRSIKMIRLYSPSPLTMLSGITFEKKIIEYKKVMPELEKNFGLL